MNTCCNKCNSCGCGDCGPARYSCNSKSSSGKRCKCKETCTTISTNASKKILNYKGECGTSTITGAQLGELIRLEDLADTDILNKESCQLLAWDPHCGCDTDCEEGCEKITAKWTNYTIPDAGDCEIEQTEDGYYKVLIKDDCGCIKECRLPIVADLNTISCYVRDSVPDDPDWPWYYGIYNDTIHLYLEQNAGAYFGKYDLEVTVNYGIQVVRPTRGKNMNFRSLVVPVIEGETTDAEHMSSILQGNATASVSASDSPIIPWGTQSMRGTITFIVPKGKEADLRHEFRFRSYESVRLPGCQYATSEYDGQRVPTEKSSVIDQMDYNASRLNALQVLIKPTNAYVNKSPVIDTARDQLDDPVDIIPNMSGGSQS